MRRATRAQIAATSASVGTGSGTNRAPPAPSGTNPPSGTRVWKWTLRLSFGAFRDFFPRAKPRILEPIMKVSMEGPAEFSGNMLSLIMQRRGIVIGSTEDDGGARVDAEVPLAEMFGFSTPLRSATQGKAEFTMEFAKYSEVRRTSARRSSPRRRRPGPTPRSDRDRVAHVRSA
jgi:hypothetical protein